MSLSLNRTKLIRALKKAGFGEIKRKSTNYTLLAKQGHPHILRIPTYKQSDVPRGTLVSIVKAAGLTLKELEQYL